MEMVYNLDPPKSPRTEEESIDQMIRRLEHEVETKKRLLHLQSELDQLNAELQNNSTTKSQFVSDDVDNAVGVFSGDDDDYNVDEFLGDFFAAALHFDWSDRHKFVYSKRFIAGTAKTFLRVAS